MIKVTRFTFVIAIAGRCSKASATATWPQLDRDAGTPTVKKNGVQLGVAAAGLRGEFCWAVALYGAHSIRRVRIAATFGSALL